MHPVSAVKERYRKGGKCKISRVLQSPVSSTQASPKVEASNRPKQAQHFSTCRKVQDGNSRVHQNLPDSRGMGCVDRSIGRLPPHPHPSSLKEIPKILPQVSGVPVHLPTFRTGHSPPGLYHDRKGGEAHGPLQRSQTLVTASTGVQTDLPKVVHSPHGPVRHLSEPQASTVRVSYPRPEGLRHRCSKHKLDGFHCLCLPSNGSPSQGDPKNQAMQLSDHTNSPRLARDALVLGPSAALNRDPTAAPGVNNTPQAVPQLRVPQQPAAPQPPCLVSRSGQLQEQGFSVEVAERIAAPQRASTRTIYKSKWALFEKWCRENSVDFSTPSVKQISDFFMYLYQDLNRRPSTIDGYRTAIVDTLGPSGQHIAHNEDLHRLFSSLNRDRPKSSRNLPKWNLSVVLNELTKAPFEPMKDTDLKHLTLKTFLLALASGKRRSEIHAWVANKVSNLGQWEKVALFPSSDFIAKNQLAREGSQSVSPVTIPALTTIVDRQFKEDRTLCPVRALRYYLDRTKDLRGSRSLLFISFKKGHTSDIRPATLSSWLKQTILLCYKQADQQALDLVQAKAHDIRAFAASKAFYGGVSVDQIMQACHWKAHNTFTNFYLKDLTWSDNDNNLYLGPVVAAQQVLDPSPQSSHPRKEKGGGGGGGGTSGTTKSSGV